MEKLDLSYIKEELPKLHNTYVGASEKETELEFLKVSMQDYKWWTFYLFQSKEEVLEDIHLKAQVPITDAVCFISAHLFLTKTMVF